MVLSGTASDGTLSLEAIKAEGGIIFAQEYRQAQLDAAQRHRGRLRRSRALTGRHRRGACSDLEASLCVRAALELSTFREDDRGEDDTIIISGGVASTVYSARDHDYNLVIVRDACSNSHDDSMAGAHEHGPRLARVRSTDRVLE